MKKSVKLMITIGAAVVLCAACGNKNAGNDTETVKAGVTQDKPVLTDEPEETEELAYDDVGLPFVKNQIVIMTDLKADKKEVETLIADIGGKEIEYIDGVETRGIQLEGEWTYEKLEELVQQLEQDPMIVYADLNYIGGESQPN